jgi:hypothetical protein
MLVEQQVYSDEADTQIENRSAWPAGGREQQRTPSHRHWRGGRARIVRTGGIPPWCSQCRELVDQSGSRLDWTPIDRCMDEIVERSADSEHVPCATRRQRLLEHGDAPYGGVIRATGQADPSMTSSATKSIRVPPPLGRGGLCGLTASSVSSRSSTIIAASACARWTRANSAPRGTSGKSAAACCNVGSPDASPLPA